MMMDHPTYKTGPNNELIISFDITGCIGWVIPSSRGFCAKTFESAMGVYPSSQWWAQYALLQFPETWLMIRLVENRPAIQTWWIRPNLNALEITLADGRAPGFSIEAGESPLALIELYKQWARLQPWWQVRKFPRNYMQTGSQNVWWAVRDAFNRLNPLIPNSGVWCTNYRNFTFDNMYPNFEPAPGWQDMWQEIEDQGGAVYPYLNGSYWDERHPDYDPNNMIQRADGTVANFAPKPYLKTMCLSVESNKQLLVEARDAFETIGVYVDAIGFAPEPCYHPDHDHEPGDCRQIVDNTNDLLQRMQGEIMTETFAETSLGLADGYLSLGQTGMAKTRPTPPALMRTYGEIMSPMGCQFGNYTEPGAIQALFADAIRQGLPYPTVNNAADIELHENNCSREILTVGDW